MESPQADNPHDRRLGASNGRRVWLALLLLAVSVAFFVLVVWPLITKPSPGGPNGDQHSAGFVLDMKGDWTCQELGNRPLAGGDVLPAGGHIQPLNPESSPWIRVILRDGSDNTYDTPRELPDVVVPRLTERFWDALVNNYSAILRSDTLVARGGGRSPVPLDAPVRIAGSALDLSAVFAAMPAGSYDLSFYDLDPLHPEAISDITAKSPRFQIKFAWDPQHPRPASVVNCPPGLYFVQLAVDQDETLIQPDFWILVTPAHHFDDTLAAYAAALSADVRAGAPNDPEKRTAARWLRRATLTTLAASPPK